MTDDARRGDPALGGSKADKPVGREYLFNDVFRREVELINARRGNGDPRGRVKLENESTEASAQPVQRPNEGAAVVGLALSGGGIRSSAFCLGVLQALHEGGVLKRVDYLSTVSGGGYIGASLTSAMELAGRAGKKSDEDRFPFKSRLLEDEPPALQHLRNYSNFLFPGGAVDILRNGAIYARGLVANALLVLPFLLFAAALTINSYQHPAKRTVTANFFGLFEIPNVFGFRYFVVTAYLAFALLAGMVIWGLVRSWGTSRVRELPHGSVTFAGWGIAAVLFAAFCEMQPFVIDARLYQTPGGVSGFLSNWVNWLSVVLAPFAAIIAFLGRQIGEFLKSSKESLRARSQYLGYVLKAAIYVAAVIVPFLLWVVYLNLAIWGIPPRALTPEWLNSLLIWSGWSSAVLYSVAGGLFLVVSFLLRPNANSLHPMYRDRLGHTFLFEPQDRLAKDEMLKPKRLRLSEISGAYGPYHLINCALNVQNSKTANKRGRNADFFMFSSQFVGSRSTNYVETKDMEKIAPELDLATAMAASGAAAASNMGIHSIKPLTPTLALLNVRLGYWLRNPRKLLARFSIDPLSHLYFLTELLGLLNEHRKSIYLTDGGHIENLGIYELLRRRCEIIIAVDGEADPEMAFGSLNNMERYALIDLGVRIELPWQQLTDAARRTGEEIDKTGDTAKRQGPHCAVGEILYPEGRRGVLIYVKSSLTGDENDYIFHYKRRYARFPHETTIDQMFSEEQFEAYRALGFHVTYGLFDRDDEFAFLDPDTCSAFPKHLALLDRLFPRTPKPEDPSGQQKTFVAMLQTMIADRKAKRDAAVVGAGMLS